MASSVPNTMTSSYLEYLPAILGHDGDDGGASFIGRFLLAFEEVLTGLPGVDTDHEGLEEVIDRIGTYFDPGPVEREQATNGKARAPAEFLPWLASWVALVLRDDWSEEEKRRIIGSIVPIYQRRGTKQGLIQMLQAYVGSAGVEIHEMIDPLQVGKTCTIGDDTTIGGGPLHFFLVRIRFPGEGDLGFQRMERIARAIIDQEKPAHTCYYLHVIPPQTMQIGKAGRSEVGVSTFLGSLSEQPKEKES